MSQMQAPGQSQQYDQPAADRAAGTSQSMSQQPVGQSVQQPQQSFGQQPAQPRQTGSIAGPVGQRFPTQSFLSEDVRTTSIGLLNQCLADLTAVQMQLKDAHWNVKGIEFYQLHGLFEDMIETLDPHIDEVAERVSSLGGQALGTAQDVVRNSTMPALSRQAVDGESIVRELIERLAILDATLHRQIQMASDHSDLDTADLLNEVSRDVSKMLWFLEAHLQGPGQTQSIGQQQ